MVGFSNKKDGQDVRVHGTFGATAIPIDRALHAPRLDTVNEQIRGPNTGNQYGVAAMTVQTAISTRSPSLPSCGEASRYPCSYLLAWRSDAPKRDVVNEQVRGARD